MTRQSEVLSLSGFVLREAWRDAAKTVLLYAVTKNPLIGRPLLRAARSGRLPERVFSKLPAAGVFTVSVGDGASFRYAATRDDGIGRYLYWRGLDWRGLAAWESATTRMFFAAARRARIVVDVGANTGIYTLLACAASPHCRVVAFEPVPRVFRRLEENIALNGWQGRCEARCEAIADRDGVVPFHIPQVRLPRSASLHPDGFRGWRGVLVELPVRRLDDALPSHRSVDLVKIDVEGFEDSVLRGMTGILSQSAPDLIVECLPDGPLAEIEATVRRFSYRLYQVTRSGPVPRERLVASDDPHEWNYLFSVKSHTEVEALWSDREPDETPEHAGAAPAPHS